MHYLFTVLDILFLSWFFWVPLVIVPIACYYAIASSIDDDHTWSGWPLTCLLLLGGAVLYRWPAARLTDWHTWLYYGLAYVAAGFGVALYKWVVVLAEFRKGDAKEKIAEIKKDSTRLDRNTLDALRRHFRDCTVELRVGGIPEAQVFEVFPDWRKHPISTWWTYWPFFILSIPLDWLTHGIEWAADLLKDFWNGIAQRFSVKG